MAECAPAWHLGGLAQNRRTPPGLGLRPPWSTVLKRENILQSASESHAIVAAAVGASGNEERRVGVVIGKPHAGIEPGKLILRDCARRSSRSASLTSFARFSRSRLARK